MPRITPSWEGITVIGTVAAVDHPVRAIGREFAGSSDQIGLARDFVRRRLPRSCPQNAVEEISLGVSEITTNALQHSHSGRGGRFSVVVHVDGRTVRVEVFDGGPVAESIRHGTDDLDEGGRGLVLVRAVAERVGYEVSRDGGMTWFEYAWTDGV